jgi:hypothetical protein
MRKKYPSDTKSGQETAFAELRIPGIGRVHVYYGKVW